MQDEAVGETYGESVEMNTPINVRDEHGDDDRDDGVCEEPANVALKDGEVQTNERGGILLLEILSPLDADDSKDDSGKTKACAIW